MYEQVMPKKPENLILQRVSDSAGRAVFLRQLSTATAIKSSTAAAEI
jgi:hypothetical protein